VNERAARGEEGWERDTHRRHRKKREGGRGEEGREERREEGREEGRAYPQGAITCDKFPPRLFGYSWRERPGILDVLRVRKGRREGRREEGREGGCGEKRVNLQRMPVHKEEARRAGGRT
jgi:hypothetical protein